MKFLRTQVHNFEGALYGMRMPMASHSKSDSYYGCSNYAFQNGKCQNCPESLCAKRNVSYVIGENDMRLCKSLIKAGSPHCKFLRDIFVSTVVKMPMYVASEFDTYKVGTTRNSSSFQHKGTSKPFSLEDFEEMDNQAIESVINELNRLRDLYLQTKDYKYFIEIRKLLPASYLYTFSWTSNYQGIYNMYKQRCIDRHKLKDWNTDFKEWCESLPYFKEFFLEGVTT